MGFHDAGDGKDSSIEQFDSSEKVTEVRENKIEADKIGDELEGKIPNDKEMENKEGDKISSKNRKIESESEIKEASFSIEKELEGDKVVEGDSLETVYNDAGEEIATPYEIRNEKYYERGKDGEVLVDDNGNPKVDWNTYSKYDAGKNSFGAEGADNRYEIKETTLQPGEKIDRYGSEVGKNASPLGESYESRSLPYKQQSMEYHSYEVVKPIKCVESTAAPNFGCEGGAKQYKFEKSFDQMLDDGDIVEIDKENENEY